MAYEFKAVRRVEFSDTDLAGIMHFSNYFRFMETAEHGFLRALGYSVILSGFNPPMSLPRVHAACDYKAPLRFEDEVEIHLLVQRKKPRTITYQFRFWKRQAQPALEVARGQLTVVCVVHRADGTMAAAPLPEVLARQIEEAPAALLAHDNAAR